MSVSPMGSSDELEAGKHRELQQRGLEVLTSHGFHNRFSTCWPTVEAQTSG
jgi:hypothetical protein